MSTLSAVLVSLYLFFGFWPHNSSSAQAQTLSTNPKTEGVSVSAAVLDNEAPTTPILVSPQDGELITTNRPTFVWQPASDTNGIKEYQLSLDGQIKIKHIPDQNSITNQNHQTSNYSLKYDSANQQFKLTLKQTLNDGTHTWKIRALDSLNNGTDSATWSFTIDTQAPSFVLTNIGSLTTSISAQDFSTIPDQPLTIEANSPQLLAHGEANSEVELLVTIPNDPSQNFSNSTDVNGNWGEQLGILPRETVITLDFTITDQAGLVSVLPGVEFLITQKKFVYPTGGPVDDSGDDPTGDPGDDPEASVAPRPSGAPHLISIPLTPPIEIAYEILQESFEHLPQPIRKIVSSVPAETRRYLAAEAQQLSPVFGASDPDFAWLTNSTHPPPTLRPPTLPHLFYRALQALHLLPTDWPPHHHQPQGLVYDAETQNPVTFALVEVWQEDTLVGSVITDKSGLYTGLNLPANENNSDENNSGESSPAENDLTNYHLTIKHPHYRFPTNQPTPTHLTESQFYRGQVFTLSATQKTNWPALKLVPLDFIPATKSSFSLNPVLSLLQLAHFYSFIFWPIFVILGLIAILLPTPLNLATFAFYLLLALRRIFVWFAGPNLQGTVIDQDGQPLTNVIVEILTANQLSYLNLLQTDSEGRFSTRLPTTPPPTTQLPTAQQPTTADSSFKLRLTDSSASLSAESSTDWQQNSTSTKDLSLDPSQLQRPLILQLSRL